MEEINDKLTIVDNSISSINNSITTITGDITTIKNNVSSMNETIINHTSAISTINEQIANINKTISDNYTDLSKKITAIENSLNIFQEDVNYKLTNINNSLTSITNDLNGIKGNIKTINNKIETIQSNLTDLTARVSQNEIDISDIKEQLKKLVLTGKTTLYGTIDITNQEVGIKNAVGRAYTAGSTGEVFNDYETNAASGNCASAHGSGNTASGNYSFAANNTNTVKANAATVTGFNNIVTQSAIQSFTSGANNLNDSKRGMVTGQFNKIINDNEIAGGEYNSSTEELPLARSYGNGTSDENRSNLEYLTLTGNHYTEGSYLMHPLPENFDLDNLGAFSETYSTDMNKWYYTTGAIAKTIKNIPEVITSDLLTYPQAGFVLKVMNYDRQSNFYPDGYMTSVQVLYCGGAIFSRGYLIESHLGWSPWKYIGGISASNDALISLADDQPSYLNITSQGGETTLSVHYNSNLTFYYNFFISVNTEVKTVQVNIKDESQSSRTFFSTAGIGYLGDDRFEYRLKDKNTLIMTSESGFKVGARYNVILYGTFNPVK